MSPDDKGTPDYIEWSEEAAHYIADFLSGRNLHEYRTQDVKRREEHDENYQKYVRKEEKRIGNFGPKKYREDHPNKQSKCDSQFVNNLHTYRTCDGGSGYHAEQKHYAVDFVLDKNAADLPKWTTDLKKLKVFSKNKAINHWMNEQCEEGKLGIRRAFSCINLSADSLGFEDPSIRLKRTTVDFNLSLISIDPTFLSELYGLDASRVFYGIANGLSHLIARVNSENYKRGEIKISKVLCGTSKGFAYVIPEAFNKKKALLDFTSEYERFLLIKQERLRNQSFEEKNIFKQYVNVALYLKEFEDDKTQYRRARHIFQVPSKCYPPIDLYLELDTGELRVVQRTTKTVTMLARSFSHAPMAIVEVRFCGAKSQEEVIKHIESIRNTGKAMISSVDEFDRLAYFPSHYRENPFKKWSTTETLELKTYKQHLEPRLTTLFCEDPDCRGMCSTDVYFKKPKPIASIAPALEKLTELRNQFTSEAVMRQTPKNMQLSGYIVPVTDAHQSERTPDHYARLKFLSGFGGTKGTAIITSEKAVLWTDNQHFKLAQREMDMAYWTVKNYEEKETETMSDWIAQNIPSGSVIGFDPTLITITFYTEVASQLKYLEIKLAPLHTNLVDNMWKDRPYRRGDVVQVMGLGECGRSAMTKIDDLRRQLAARNCTATVVSSLDDVMWLLNIRGNDLEFSPLAYSYLFLTMREVHLFIDLEKLDIIAQTHLTQAVVKYHSYRNFFSYLTNWWEKNQRYHQLILLTTDTSYSIASVFPKNYIIEESVVQKVKSRKNLMELGGMRASNIRHSVAIVEFLHWIEQETSAGRVYTETQLIQKIEEFKSSDMTYAGPSVPTLFSSGENSSDLKHKPESSHTVIDMQKFLLQSGGQYKNGSTLATRTFWELDATEEFICNYTSVLKCHVQVASSRFPNQLTQGYRLDVLARQALWNIGLDYDHDPGHSVGHYLKVREMPGNETSAVNDVISAGQVITIEPGFFKRGEYGIQIGNCYETRTDPSRETTFLEFTPLTLIPFQTSIISKNLLTPEEILWINKYHYRVFAEIGSILRDENKLDAWKWLQDACLPI
uniref:Peptidase_M24 domain-containing protein n=1 Tax=Caenorhabditis tropicalis TaxID=1561998 RepID=A0A1I7TXL1_9PELO